MNKEKYALDTFLTNSIKPKPYEDKEFYHISSFNIPELFFKYQEWCSGHDVSNVDEKEFENRLQLHIKALNKSHPQYIFKQNDSRLKNEIAEMIINKLHEHGMEVEKWIQPCSYFPEFDIPKVLRFNPSGEMWEYFKRPHKAKSWVQPEDSDGNPFKMISVPALALHYFRDIFSFIDERHRELRLNLHACEYYLYIYKLIDWSFSDKLKAEIGENIHHDRLKELNEYAENQFINGVKMWNDVEDEQDENVHGNQEFWSNIETTPEERFYMNLTLERVDEPRLTREMFYFYPE